MSNSKLTPSQKGFLKSQKEWFGDRLVFGYSGPVTVAVIANENGLQVAKFAASIAGASEQKFRKKVGQYFAADRALNDGSPVDLNNFASAQDAADCLAQALSGGFDSFDMSDEGEDMAKHYHNMARVRDNY